MIDLQTETAEYHWTHVDVDDVKADKTWGSRVFWTDAIKSYSIGAQSMVFDTPMSWIEPFGVTMPYPVTFTAGEDGLYRYNDEEGSIYEAVRADTPTHVVLTGTCQDPGVKGTFIAVFPRQKDQ